jgi:hypothetical protein
LAQSSLSLADMCFQRFKLPTVSLEEIAIGVDDAARLARYDLKKLCLSEFIL